MFGISIEWSCLLGDKGGERWHSHCHSKKPPPLCCENNLSSSHVFAICHRRGIKYMLRACILCLQNTPASGSANAYLSYFCLPMSGSNLTFYDLSPCLYEAIMSQEVSVQSRLQ